MRKNKNNLSENSLSLDLSTADGDRLYRYSPQVIDSMRNMASRLMRTGKLPECLGFIAALQQEGVTYLSRAWGLTIANDLQINVCIVELNWWRPDKMLTAGKSSPGLAALLQSKAKLQEALVATNYPNLSLIPAGQLNFLERPIQARGEALKTLITGLRQQFDHVVLDIPAIRATTDAQPLAFLPESVCLVVQQGVTTVENARLALDAIGHLPIAGVVLNRYRTSTPDWVLRLIPQDATVFSG